MNQRMERYHYCGAHVERRVNETKHVKSTKSERESSPGNFS